MPDAADWHWGLCNCGPRELLLWLEPWADEIKVPSMSTVTMRIRASDPDNLLIEVEHSEHHLVIWGAGGQSIEVFVDRVLQRTGSALIEVPEAFSFSTKKLLGIVFDNQPSARLAGSHASVVPKPLWQRIKHRLKFW
ncbi:hypothetical protein [Novosphingobium sp.]|uniref:hypothetical protein n=1 Tax=Novosphingobium sp. TaxID=1874826 RepID=UPI001DD527BD|nr:hypothetical protein [Novosphingobium sp.]MBX9664074.1 hypothetical protein [Novosphingobium sp.]